MDNNTPSHQVSQLVDNYLIHYQRINNPEVDEDLPSKEEAERLVKEVYSMDNEPIFIPENIKNRVKKKHNSDISSDSMHSNSKEMDDKIDTETRIENMLMDFDGTLKE